MRYIQCDVCDARIDDESDVIEVRYESNRLDLCTTDCMITLAGLMAGITPEEMAKAEEPVVRITPPVSSNHFQPISEDQIEQVTGVVRRGRATRE